MERHTKTRACQGSTLIEVVVSIVIIMVLATGVMSYQYHAVRQVRRAKAENTATQIGMLLLENWKVLGGDENFDPCELELGIEEVGKKDLYLTVFNEVPLYFDLSFDDLEADAITGITLRQLTLVMQWNSNYEKLVPDASAPTLELTSYVRLDQSGG